MGGQVPQRSAGEPRGAHTGRKFTRLYAPDPRDRLYRIAGLGVKTALSKLVTKSWTTGAILDQGGTSECVRYSETQLLQTRPIQRTNALSLTAELYPWAQKNDEWPGENYDGTSVRAGLQYLRTQAHLVDSFHWAMSMDEVLAWLSGNGPLVIGSEWFTGMDVPDAHGYITPTGDSRGGHAWLVTGIAVASKRVTMTNSWGEYWGGEATAAAGKAYLSWDALEYLIFGANGEAAAVIETPQTRKKAA